MTRTRCLESYQADKLEPSYAKSNGEVIYEAGVCTQDSHELFKMQTYR